MHLDCLKFEAVRRGVEKSGQNGLVNCKGADAPSAAGQTWENVNGRQSSE